VRVVRPRFAFHTGHVTVGGSLCNELLTRKGWSPENTIEAVLMTVRSSFMAGGARLDRSNRADYTMQEAKVAYDRLVAQHGWG
jgi:ubiquitin-conjugating enzyme E2 Q